MICPMSLPLDIAAELAPDAETWRGAPLPSGEQVTLARWPDGRGAICLGGDSQWGDWHGDVLVLDDGATYSDAGEEVVQD